MWNSWKTFDIVSMWMWLLEGLSCWQTLRICPLPLVAEWGLRGCLCEVAQRHGQIAIVSTDWGVARLCVMLCESLVACHTFFFFFFWWRHSCFLRLDIDRIWKLMVPKGKWSILSDLVWWFRAMNHFSLLYNELFIYIINCCSKLS